MSWVHVFVTQSPLLQLGEATLYAAALELMEACIKRLNAMNAFQEEVSVVKACVKRLSTKSGTNEKDFLNQTIEKVKQLQSLGTA